ncbi:hypothetical protein V8D89_008987 [Ganoderma adspersum]
MSFDALDIPSLALKASSSLVKDANSTHFLNVSYKPTKSGAQTSREVASMDHEDAVRPNPVELEASGGLEIVLRHLNGDSTASDHGENRKLILRRLNGDLATPAGANQTSDGAKPLTVAPYCGLPWDKLCEAEDQLGPLPPEWKINNEFWRDYESSASEHEDDEMQQAIAASITSAQLEARHHDWSNDSEDSSEGNMSAMAVIIEVKTETKPVKPEGPDGWFTSKQKQKSVPRTSEQHEYLRSFTRGDMALPPPLPNAAQHAHPTAMPEPSRHRPTASGGITAPGWWMVWHNARSRVWRARRWGNGSTQPTEQFRWITQPDIELRGFLQRVQRCRIEWRWIRLRQEQLLIVLIVIFIVSPLQEAKE